MQSLLIFIAEFQTAKRRLLNNFEVSDGRSSLVHCITYNHSAVAFKMGRRQGARRAHI